MKLGTSLISKVNCLRSSLLLLRPTAGFWMTSDLVNDCRGEYVEEQEGKQSVSSEISDYEYKRVAIPLQAWTDCTRSRLSEFWHSTRRRGKDVSPTHRPPLPHRRYGWYSFLLEAESSSASQCGQKSVTPIGNRTRNLLACGAVSQPTAQPRIAIYVGGGELGGGVVLHGRFIQAFSKINRKELDCLEHVVHPASHCASLQLW